jgi:predicted enzyme related to lactoylglutathione lyase
MDLHLSHTFLTVDDQDQALAFYRDVLELEVRNDVTMETFRWVTLSPKSQPEVEIVLMDPRMTPHQADVDTLLSLMTKGALNGVIFRTDDVDAAFEKIRASGAEVMQEPIDQPYGVRDCGFRDPSGNPLRVAGPLRG